MSTALWAQDTVRISRARVGFPAPAPTCFLLSHCFLLLSTYCLRDNYFCLPTPQGDRGPGVLPLLIGFQFSPNHPPLSIFDGPQDSGWSKLPWVPRVSGPRVLQNQGWGPGPAELGQCSHSHRRPSSSRPWSPTLPLESPAFLFSLPQIPLVKHQLLFGDTFWTT